MSLVDVLLVEDSPADARLVTEFLRSETTARQVIAVDSGEEALRLLRSATIRPRLVLLDLSLPGIDGSEVLATIKADSRLRRLPVVILSGSDDPRDVEQAYELRANAYVVKPADLDQYRDVIKAICDFWLLAVR